MKFEFDGFDFFFEGIDFGFYLVEGFVGEWLVGGFRCVWIFWNGVKWSIV